MEINELFRKLDKGGYSSTLMQFKKAFFNKTAEEFFIYNYGKKYGEIHNRMTWERFPTEILRKFPDAKLYYDENQNLKISLSNADFEIWGRRLSFPEFPYQLNIEGKYNVIDFMEQVNNLLPKWNTEFLQLCRENAKRIEEFELKRLMYGHNQNIVQKYIRSKIDNLCLMQRKDYAFYKKENSLQWRNKNLGKPEKKRNNYSAWSRGYYFFSLKNMSVKLQFYQRYMSLDINGLTLTEELDLGYSPMILQIDELLPQWLEEAACLKHEYEKKEKTEQIATNTSIIVVKNKMKEFGYEYHYNHTKRELEIKLEKKRKLVITLAINNMEKLKEKLNALPTYVEAINNVPMNYRIHFQIVGNERWMKEENS
ncbi:MAG: hypothetical protein K5860_08010 [Bacteroidales bacterium]|nr:hypothetical protein [Bacteroidales bacterium]